MTFTTRHFEQSVAISSQYRADNATDDTNASQQSVGQQGTIADASCFESMANVFGKGVVIPSSLFPTSIRPAYPPQYAVAHYSLIINKLTLLRSINTQTPNIIYT